jgi:hypothetical protein
MVMTKKLLLIIGIALVVNFSSKATIYTVSNLLDNNTTTGANQGDLRWCINQVVANAATGPHTINFGVAGTIIAGSPYTSMTNILGGVTIDGFTAPGWTANPIVAIDGPGYGECFTFTTTHNSIVQGVVLFDWGGNGSVYLNGSNNCIIRGCWFGVNAAQAQSGGANGAGIFLSNSNNNSIGGDLSVNPTYKVWINNKQDGIRIEGNSRYNTVYGTFVGTNLAGTAVLIAGQSIQNAAVYLRQASYNSIGATGTGRRNILSRANYGVLIENTISRRNIVYNNLIGTNLAGATALPNGTNGVRIKDGCHNNEIGGKIAGEGNIISGNSQEGVYLEGNVDSTLIGRNYIGLAADGSTLMVNGTGNNHHAINVGGNTCEYTKIFYNVIVTPGRGSGIYNDGAGYDSICYNYIGTDATGLLVRGIGTDANQAGIMMNGGNAGPNNVFIGNVVAASTGNGIEVRSGAKNNMVFKGNIVGMNANGLGTTFGNAKTGIYIHPAASTNLTFGGTTVADRNIVSRNGRGTAYGCSSTDGAGLIIEQMNGASIYGNYIGVDATGNVGAGNGNSGISLNGGNNNIVIGSMTAGARNVVCDNGKNCTGPPNNTRHGIQFVSNGAATNMQVVGNYVGIGADGNTMIGNAEENISSWQTPNILIQNNVVAGGNKGIFLQPASAINCRIYGNYVGTDATGTLARPNNIGVHIANGANLNTVGGTGAGEGNVISGNTTDGLLFEDGDNNTVQQNKIGLTALNMPLGNGTNGVRIKSAGSNGSTLNLIGHATNTSLANMIAFNTSNGVLVEDVNSNRNAIRRNSIYCNGSARQNGINLNAAGNTNLPSPGPLVVPAYVTAPTPGIVTANTPAGDVAGTDVVEVFYDDACGTCQGRTYLGNATISGTQWSFSPLPAASDCSPKGVAGCLSGVKNITATRTDNNGNTSEFMDCDPLYLPISLLSFKAVKYGVNDALISWSTTSETNNAYFELLRSTDGATFYPVAKINGAGNSSVLKNYSFKDENLSEDLYYYMLIQVDYDGTSTNSPIVSVNMSDKSSVEIIPTAVVSGEQIKIVNFTGQDLVSVSFVDMSGKILSEHKSISSVESYITTVGVAPGLYMVKVNTSQEQLIKKVLVY